MKVGSKHTAPEGADKEMLQVIGDRLAMKLGWNDTSGFYDYSTGEEWNPLNDDGAALRLAVENHLEIAHLVRDGGFALASLLAIGTIEEPYGQDKMAATRRAIVRATYELLK